MPIYTKTGDQLQTDTLQKRTYKNDILVETSGSIDELQAQVMAASHCVTSPMIKEILVHICQTLFSVNYDIGSLQSTLSIDKVTEIPGKTKEANALHLARTAARRTERIIVSYALENTINDVVLKYMNRISDLFFVLARTLDELPKD